MFTGTANREFRPKDINRQLLRRSRVTGKKEFSGCINETLFLSERFSLTKESINIFSNLLGDADSMLTKLERESRKEVPEKSSKESSKESSKDLEQKAELCAYRCSSTHNIKR